MFLLLSIIAFFVVGFLIIWLCERVPQFIRDRAASQALDGFDIDKARAEIMSINDACGSVSPRLKCPSCGGMLEARDCMKVHFLRCSRFPTCTYIRRAV